MALVWVKTDGMQLGTSHLERSVHQCLVEVKHEALLALELWLKRWQQPFLGLASCCCGFRLLVVGRGRVYHWDRCRWWGNRFRQLLLGLWLYRLWHGWLVVRHVYIAVIVLGHCVRRRRNLLVILQGRRVDSDAWTRGADKSRLFRLGVDGWLFLGRRSRCALGRPRLVLYGLDLPLLLLIEQLALAGRRLTRRRDCAPAGGGGPLWNLVQFV